jgi:predicted phage tail protein
VISSEFVRLASRLGALVLCVVLAAATVASAQTTVTARWDANTDSHTVGYRVYYGTASGSYQWNVDAGNATSAPLTLQAGSTYYVTVRAYNASLQLGPPSNEATISLTSPPPPPPPPAPAPTAQISATLGANNVATVIWQTANATSATVNGVSVPLSGTTNVSVSTTTTFTVVARAADGRQATASATVSPTTAPAPTAQITATMQSATTALLSWQSQNATSATINGTAVALSGSTTVTVTQPTTYTLTARAADGRIASSSASVAPPTQTAPGAPGSMSSSVSESRVTLAWRAPTSGGAPTHYLLDVGTSPGRSNVVSARNVGDVLRVSGDLPRGRYYARVRAANASGVSPASNEVEFRIGRQLRAPTNLSVAWSGTTATFTWNLAAADTAEDVPSGYVLEAGTASGLTDVATLNVGNVSTFSTDVPVGTYYVRLRSVNSLGDSDPSNEVVVQAPGAPEPPSSLRASGTGSQVNLEWSAPSTGSVPTGYIIEAGSAPGLSNLAVLRVAGVTTFATVAPPGVYYVRVRAVNARGTSAPSNEIVVRR